jgi:hypothetical protein
MASITEKSGIVYCLNLRSNVLIKIFRCTRDMLKCIQQNGSNAVKVPYKS